MSLYRISTANAYDSTIARINQRSTELAQTQEHLSAGKRVLRATDDPVAATLAERENNRLQRTQADLRALERSRSSMEQVESTLGNMVDAMHRIKELVVQGGNTTLSNSDRKSIAEELRGLRDQLLNLANTQDTEGNALLGGLGVINTLGKPFADVYGLSNDVQFQAIGGQTASSEVSIPSRVDGQFTVMRNMTGNGTFVASHLAGNLHIATGSVVDNTAINGNVLPYDPAATPQGYYQLDVVQDATVSPPHLNLQVTRVDKNTGTATVLAPATDLGQDTGKPISLSNVSVQFEGLQVTLSGSAAVGAQLRLDPSQPDDLFATVQRAIDALEDTTQANPGPHLTQELGRVHDELSTGLDRLSLVRGRAGEYLNRADTIDSQLQDRQVAHENAVSNLTDLDMVKGISDFQSQQTGLQAALQSYAQVQKLSLFQYIA